MRRYLIAGVLIWVPIGITVLLLQFLVRLADRTLLLIPEAYRPEALLGFHIPGLGLILALLILLFTGILVANLVGRKLVEWAENLLARIPFVRTVYQGAKQVMETVLSSSGNSFRKVLLVEYPRAGTWSLAFQTATEVGEVQDRTGEEVVSVFVPTTPNPTSGFLIMVPKNEVIELSMTVDEAVRMIISLGVVVPPWPPQVERPAAPQPPEEGR